MFTALSLTVDLQSSIAVQYLLLGRASDIFIFLGLVDDGDWETFCDSAAGKDSPSDNREWFDESANWTGTRAIEPSKRRVM